MSTNGEPEILRCPLCGGTEFDEERRLTNTLYSPGGFFGMVTGLRIRARACLTCGFVAQFVDPEKAKKMARKDLGS
ncbi:MAG: hypothetical protein JXA11_16705 [Phycisphaerae bacterium]|nr:hypothetical protein [Phycisphaerae bacterium]